MYWGSQGFVTYWSFIMSLFLLIKDVIIITLFIIRKYIEGRSDPKMRPALDSKSLTRIGRESTFNMKVYLMNANDDEIDEEGNTSIHCLSKFEDLSSYGGQVESQPHLLFMLNKAGFTPLDVAVAEQDEEKAFYLIKKIAKISNFASSMKYIKRPHRLEFKFEKAFTLAI